MYVKIRRLDAKPGDSDLTITISKNATIDVLREQIQQKWNCEPANQKLYYKGKQLEDQYRIIDYDVQLNDVIQLLIRTSSSEEKDNEKDKPSESTSNDSKPDESELIDVSSKYYKIGDLVDMQDAEYGAWFEHTISEIKAIRRDFNEDGTCNEDKIQFIGKWAHEPEQSPYCAKFDSVRPRARYTYKYNELKEGMTVLANYNIEKPNDRGYWYTMVIDKLSTTSKKLVIGTIQVGIDRCPLKDCKIKFVDEIMRLEEPVLLTDSSDCPTIPLRKSQYYCDRCRDDKNKKCKQCGCGICGGKNDPSKIILCDECDTGYHLGCLKPPLTEIPEEAEWFCPDCKNDENEIVKAGDKLKESKRKAKMKSAQQKTGGRDWGRGMACVGRTKECTIVPKFHYGHIPGIEVGTTWKFRVQVSEAGVHRPHVAGIHGRENDGAYSIVLSGGYEDDIDNGNEFYYTGSGGRDLSGNKRMAEQSCDQKLTRTNKGLALNCNAKFNDVVGAEAKDWRGGKPVRVVRNSKLAKHSTYAPKEGNRYDGLYKVVKYYPQKGLSGYKVWRYLLRRDDEVPAPWEEGGKELEMIYPPGYEEAYGKQEEAKKESKKRKSEKIQKKKGKKTKTESQTDSEESDEGNCSQTSDKPSASVKKQKKNKSKATKKTSKETDEDSDQKEEGTSSKSTASEQSDSESELSTVKDDSIVKRSTIKSKRKHSENVEPSNTKIKNKKDDSKSEKSGKRKHVLSEKNDNISPVVKKAKIEKYELSTDILKLIDADDVNKKLWEEASLDLEKGKYGYLDKVQNLFMCIVCQELVYNAITIDCFHNICEECLKRSFRAQHYNCPVCRFELGENYEMKINQNLAQALQLLLPGYEKNRTH